MTGTALLVDPLLEAQAHPRVSFVKFTKKVKSFVDRHGRDHLILTYCAAQGALDEAIDAEELDKPRTGIYRARVNGYPGKIEAEFTHALDTPPKDPRLTIDSSYQQALETLTVQNSALSTQVIESDARYYKERDLRFAAEEKLRLAERKIVDLEAHIEEHDEPIFDDSMIDLVRTLFGEWMNIEQCIEAASAVLDAIETNDKARNVLLETCPQLVLRLAQAAGEESDEPSEGAA